MKSVEEELQCVSLPQNVSHSFENSLTALKKEGITYLAHGLKRNGIRTCFFSHKAWQEIYLSPAVYKNDPFTQRAENTKQPYIFWDEVIMQSQEIEIDQWRKQVCNISKGLTFSIHDHDFHEILALGTSHKLFDLKSLVLNPTLGAHLSNLLKPLRYLHFCHRYEVRESVYE